MSNGSKKPKVTIKPFKHQVQMDPEYASKTWKLLEGAIKEIYRQNASGLSFEELYRNAYNMVLHKYGDVLYNGLKDAIDQHLSTVADGVALAVDENFLVELNKAWSDHKISMLMIRDILMYMDRVYVPHQNVASVYDLGLMRFRELVARSPRIRPRLIKMLLDLIHRERLGEPVQRALVRSVTQMLIDLGINSRIVYEEDFEQPFLEASTYFYHLESLSFLGASSCSDYLRKAESRMKEEIERVHHYLDSGTENKIREVVEREMIACHMKVLIEMEHSGMVSMLRDDKVEDLQRMFSLFGHISSGFQMMRDVLIENVKSIGRTIILDSEKQKDHIVLVQELLELKDKYDRLLQTAFLGNKSFVQAVNQAFEAFINMSPKAPEFVSLFIDEKLKKGLKGVSDEEVDQILDKVMMLFRFLSEKDVFEKYYKQHLAKRLLLQRSVSDDAERSMIAKLKTECGYQFTSKLEGMFTDMKLSSDSMTGFKLYLQSISGNPLGGIDLIVSVLTTGFWPTQSLPTCNLPAELLRCCEVFRKYYLSNHSGRKLTWHTNMGTAELRARFSPRMQRELIVNTYQMVILLLFNDRDEISYKEILEATAIPVSELKRNLISLASPKNKLLEKNPPDLKKVEESDIFSFNSKFTSRLLKVKVMTVSQRESEPERQETRQKVDEDRKHHIEAAIVRIMKSRKTMEHSTLILEVTKQLMTRFKPEPQIIKKRIESLIEREYLERSKTDRKIYQYLA